MLYLVTQTPLLLVNTQSVKLGRDFTHSLARSAINIEPAICNGHPALEGGECGKLDAGSGGSVEYNALEREESEGVKICY